MLFRVFMLYDCREATPLKPRGFGAPRFLEKSQDKFLGMTSQQPLSCHPFCWQHDAWWSYCLTVLKCERTVFLGFSDTLGEFCILHFQIWKEFSDLYCFFIYERRVTYYYIWKDAYNGLLNMKGEFVLVFKAWKHTYIGLADMNQQLFLAFRFERRV